MSQAFRGERIHIALFGRCNTGKSSVLNCLAGQNVAIVSEKAGTTGDPVALPFELHPLGPVTLYDTAGFDEQTDLGLLRQKASQRVFEHADMVLLVADERGLENEEKAFLEMTLRTTTPCLVIFNKADIRPSDQASCAWCEAHSLPYLSLAATAARNTKKLREGIIAHAPQNTAAPVLVADLLAPNSSVVCVTPIDTSAPKGRLIVPQVQVLRELVEYGHMPILTQPHTLLHCLERLVSAPDLVITDSQAVRTVAETLPKHVPLTTFSLLFARLKGDMLQYMHGAQSLRVVKSPARILIAEACAHHAQEDDIARVKIPQALKKITGANVTINLYSGSYFPKDLAEYALVVHCGGCMLNKKAMHHRLQQCAKANVPITNFGMVLSLAAGVLERVTAPLTRNDNSMK